MILPQALTFLEKFLDKFKYSPTFTGLLRVAGWTILFLGLTSAVLPQLPVKTLYQDSLLDTTVTSMMTEKNDLRWVRDDFRSFPKGEHLNVVWISGSSIKLKSGGRDSKLEFLPQKIDQLMTDKHGVSTRSYLYSLSGRRLLDTYTMVKDALTRNPDVLVLTINPFWVYNSKAIFLDQEVFNSGAQLWWNKYDWPWQFTLASPSNHLYSLIGRHSVLFSASRDYFALMDSGFKGLVGVGLKPPPQKLAKKHRSKKKKLSQPLKFWLQYQLRDGYIEHTKLSRSPVVWQAAAISQSNTSPSSWASVILSQILETIKNSNIPTLLYVAPVSPEMKEADALTSYKAIMEEMQKLQRDYDNNNFRFIIGMPSEVEKSIIFRDYLHQSSPGNLPQLLSGKLLELVKQK
ncbi:hypothetical protein N9063_00385 [Deltaproteobacteria bacterium]|nr:hypothetical protein [Deltaproteobacteria bacterium]